MIKRLIISLLTLISILIITFFLLHIVPGGPFDQERVLPPEIEANLYQKYGLEKRGDQSFATWLWKDLASYASRLMGGSLGPSLKYKNRSVEEIILQALPVSLTIGFMALLISVVAGILLACLTFLFPKPFFEKILTLLSSLILSVPRFVLAIGLVWIFSLQLKWLPPALYEGRVFLILPIVTLSLVPLIHFMMMALTSLQLELKHDFIRTAKAKGLKKSKIILKHALKNAALPLLTMLAPLAAEMITGSFIVETIFSLPGLGKHFVTAVIDRDYFLVMGITLVYSTLLIGLNWLTDVGYSILDPRIKKV